MNLDNQYLNLAKQYESGDKSVEQQLQQMVDNMAKKAGYNIGPVYHGGRTFNKFDQMKPSATTGKPTHNYFYFTTSEENAGFYEDGEIKRGYLKGNFKQSSGNHPPTEADIATMENYNNDTTWDGVVLSDVLDGSQYSDIYALFPDAEGTTTLFKSSSPVTKDDQGNIIPLSKRFDQQSNDIRENVFYKLYESLQPLTLYHVSNNKFAKFNPYLTAQGIIWFSNDKQHLLQDLHGASINLSKPLYLYSCSITPNKIANREDYEKYGIGELNQMGYDVIELEGDFAVINPKIIKIKEIQQIK